MASGGMRPPILGSFLNETPTPSTTRVNFIRKAIGSLRSSHESEWGDVPVGFQDGGGWTLLAEDTFSDSGGTSMGPKMSFLALAAVLMMAGLMIVDQRDARAGEVTPAPGYKVLEPIRHGNLTVFPVVAAKSYPTSEFLTLDEGLRSGEIVVTEAGNVQGLIRRHPAPGIRHDAAQVNRLVLVNNSKRPLLLLAGEIVTGGKQDRVIGKDRIVPPESDPVDLSVFCVEPGRWVATSEHFGASEAMYGSAVGGPRANTRVPMAMMAQPSVRAKAMGDKNQAEVWDEVRKQREAVSMEVAPAASIASREVANTSSYARLMENEEVKKQVDAVARPIEQNYQSLIRQLRDRNAVGIVVAVNGRIIWADVFASTDLLQKYWPKLVRSYASEAVVTRTKEVEVNVARAQAFLADMEGRREMIESEPGIYRHTEVSGDGFKAFSLTSLLPKTGFDVHVAKMAE
jgi:ARG/rhodanese/phosphatase superfamily protein